MDTIRHLLPARPVTLVIALALLVVLLLDWRHVSIETPAAHVEAGTSGISGWGIVAAISLVALLLAGLRKARPTTLLILALTAAAFVVVAFFTGSATVEAGGISVDTSTREWPAWAGLTLGATLVVSAVGAAIPPEPAAALVPRKGTGGS
jgi:hypothetical protein